MRRRNFFLGGLKDVRVWGERVREGEGWEGATVGRVEMLDARLGRMRAERFAKGRIQSVPDDAGGDAKAKGSTPLDELGSLRRKKQA